MEEKKNSLIAEDVDGVSEKRNYRVEKDEWEKSLPKVNKTLQSAIYIFLAAVFYALGYHYFIATCKFAPGGLPGIVALIQYETGATTTHAGNIDYSPLVMVFANIPILIIAAKVLSKEFAIKTFITAFLMTLIMFVMSNVIDKNYEFSIARVGKVEDVGTRIVGAVLGGVCAGTSLAFALKVNASTGGADVVGAMLQKKYPHRGVGSMVFVVNAVIMVISFFVYDYDWMPIFLAIIHIFSGSVVCDRIMQGAKSALKFEVITEHAEEIAKEVIEELGHGVTITPAKGMFEGKKKHLLICIIKPRQIAKFQNIITKYPETFAYVGSVNEIIGKFNRGRKNG